MAGVLRVKVYPAVRISGQFVKEWTEIWIEQAVLLPGFNDGER